MRSSDLISFYALEPPLIISCMFGRPNSLTNYFLREGHIRTMSTSISVRSSTDEQQSHVSETMRNNTWCAISILYILFGGFLVWRRLNELARLPATLDLVEHRSHSESTIQKMPVVAAVATDDTDWVEDLRPE